MLKCVNNYFHTWNITTIFTSQQSSYFINKTALFLLRSVVIYKIPTTNTKHTTYILTQSHIRLYTYILYFKMVGHVKYGFAVFPEHFYGLPLRCPPTPRRTLMYYLCVFPLHPAYLPPVPAVPCED